MSMITFLLHQYSRLVGKSYAHREIITDKSQIYQYRNIGVLLNASDMKMC